LHQLINPVLRENSLLSAFQQNEKFSRFFQFLGSVDGTLQVSGGNHRAVICQKDRGIPATKLADHLAHLLIAWPHVWEQFHWTDSHHDIGRQRRDAVVWIDRFQARYRRRKR
jgi:hypothetical protein